VKYSAPGSPVEVRLTQDDNEWLLEVEDHGIGIPLEDQAHVFTRFFRGDSASHIPGTGVGLDLVQRYVEGLGGNITFESEPGKGSIFRAHWPIQAP
jgi:signal transduction histidine kinase